MTPEGKIKGKIKKLLASFGARVYVYMPVPTGYGKRTLDYLVCVDGLFVGIEAKKPGGKPTSYQDNTISQIRAAGGSCFVVHDDKSLEVLQQFLHSMLGKHERDQ